MSITVKPVTPDFVAEISGLDLAQPLRPADRDDNRCTMHRARPFDTTKVRDLRHVTTRDVASTVEQAA